MKDDLRARAYRWFASLFVAELDEARWSRYQDPAVPETLRNELDELGLSTEAQALLGFIEAHRSEPSEAVVSELAADFSRLFYGPGGGLAPPYESFHAESKPRYFGDSHADVLRLMEEQRLCLPSGWSGPADHVAIELDLVAQSLTRDTVPEAADLPDNRSDQAFEHWQARVVRWIPRWSQDVQDHAETDFYRGGAALLETFLEPVNKPRSEIANKQQDPTS